MKVLVAGATGFVAGALVPRLLAAGHRVVAAGHDARRAWSASRTPSASSSTRPP